MKIYNYVYLITNNLNGKIYVGKHSTYNLNDGYMGSGKLIKLAYNKYGIENFTKQILQFAETEEELNDLEMFYIKDLDAKTKGYNLTDGGEGTVGYKMSEEAKHKISNFQKQQNCPWKHNPHSEEHNQKISESLKGEKNPFFGKHHSEETKQKLRGRKFSEEHKQKLRESRLGKTMSEETKRKISEKLNGKPKNKTKKQIKIL
jgi:group I intron endonuclease